jgi:hypothetical protein
MTLIFHCLLIWAASASASDDQSLMQQGVGIESGVLEGTVTNQFKQNLNTITSALREIPFPGKMRQMAIDALMKSVSKTEKLDPESTNLLVQIQGLLDDVLATFASETSIANTDAAVANTVIAGCNAAGDSDETTKSAAVAAAKAAHSTCRGEEVTAHGTMNTACQSVVTVLTQLSSSDCAGHHDPTGEYYGTIVEVIDKDNYAHYKVAGRHHLSGTDIDGTTDSHFLDEWVETLDKAYHNLHGKSQTWSTGQAACKTAIENFNAKAAECNTLQGTYESDYCQWVTLRDGQCSTLAACYATAVADHDNVVAGHQATQDANFATARVIVYVQCLIGTEHGLLGGNTNPDAACLPIQQAYDYSAYTFDPTTLTAEDHCEPVPGIQPGVAGFNAENYAAEDAARVAANMVAPVSGPIPTLSNTC